MEAYARSAIRASTRARRDLASAKTARLTPTRLVRALQSQTALAAPDIRDLMEAHARRAIQASTRIRQDPAAVTTALHTPTRHLEASRLQIALATPGQRGRMEDRVHFAPWARTKQSLDLRRVRIASTANIHGLSEPPLIFAWLNAETGLLQMGKKSATITTQQVAMDATPLALWNVDTVALLTIRALVLLYHVETESVQALNCATTATLRMAMDAAICALLKQDGVASRMVIA